MLQALRYWRRREEGVVAIEFSLVALPFFMLILGILETSLFFASGTVLEGASNAAARLIRTGQAQNSADPEEAFRTELCDQVGRMLECDNIQYEVIRVEPNTFAGAEAYEPEFDADGNLIPAGFSTGNSNDVVLVRTVYRYEFLTPYLGTMITGDVGKNWMTHMSTVVLKAEPYNFGEE